MLLLSGDVWFHQFEIRLAHGEIRVAALSLEAGVIATAFLQPKVGAPAPNLGARLEPETTPTALRPTAQRCGNAATLGYESNESNNLNEVVAVCARVGIATTALRLEMFVERRPRVARSPQPWALGRNPVGADKSHTRQNNLLLRRL